MATWIALAVSEEARIHGGNAGYPDDVARTYVWDSSVSHHAAVSVGDRIAIRDETLLLGLSVIDEIGVSREPKLRRRCPMCDATAIRHRKTKQPTWYCTKCKKGFPEPVDGLTDVTVYRSSHAAGWIDLGHLGVTRQELASAQASAKSQQSLRPAEWSRILDLVKANGADSGAMRILGVMTPRPEGSGGQHGFAQTLTRARRGQGAFRQGLLGRFANTCAITGKQPEAVLEAAHLYSYASVGEHFSHGGLLLRRDLHVLFDRGDIAIDPVSLRVSVSSRLTPFGGYARLEGEPVAVPIDDESRHWFQAHWDLHRR